MSDYGVDTIAAISTALGEAAVSVVRMTGPAAFIIAGKVLHTQKPVADLAPRVAHLVSVVEANGAVLDRCLALFFHAPASYTGEHTVELHCHGGVLITERVLQLLLSTGAVAAGPGEFTQRAFLNGKMDLTQAEAVMDLIHAQSTLSLRAAHEQLEGRIGQEATAMREALIHVVAHLEAYIDFPEEDISPEVGSAMQERLAALQLRCEQLLSTADQGRILRYGARTVLCGLPNAGKSSLLNAMLGFERAIVSATPGTTRDTVEELLQVGGLPLRLIDTAGLRSSTDEVEQQGIARSHKEVERADLVLEIVDASLPMDATPRVSLPEGAVTMLVLNKADLGVHTSWPAHGIHLSSTTGAGLDNLRTLIRERLLGHSGAFGDHPIAINARHQACFQRVLTALTQAQSSLREQSPPELTAFELREAMAALGEVTGRVDIEEVLDVVFSSFCIGK